MSKSQVQQMLVTFYTYDWILNRKPTRSAQELNFARISNIGLNIPITVSSEGDLKF